MKVNLGRWVFGAFAVVVLAGALAFVALLDPAPIDLLPATRWRHARVGRDDPIHLLPSATPAAARLSVVAARAEAAADGDVVVTVEIAAVEAANPLRIPPALRGADGTLYPVAPDALAEARRGLPDLAARGRVELRLVFPGFPAVPDCSPATPASRAAELTLLLNPGSTDAFAPALEAPVEGDGCDGS